MSDEIVTAKVLASLLDLSVVNVHELAKDGTIVKVDGSTGRFLLETSVRTYVRHLREIAAGRQGRELNAVDENARLKISQRRNIDLKNAVLEGTMVPLEAIRPAWARVMRAIRTAMLAVPSSARFRLQHLTPRDGEIILEIIRDQLEAAAGLDDEPPAIEAA